MNTIPEETMYHDSIPPQTYTIDIDGPGTIVNIFSDNDIEALPHNETSKLSRIIDVNEPVNVEEPINSREMENVENTENTENTEEVGNHGEVVYMETNSIVLFAIRLRKYYVFPIVSCIFMGLQWAFFLWGLYNVTNPDLNAYAGKDVYNRISPPLETFYFMTVNYWPSCTDARTNTWRIVSSQFAHSGFGHILSNTIVGIFFGSWLEIFHPWCGIFIFATFQLAVIFGALAFSYVYPYRGLIGSSGGVYGLIGASAAHLILDMDYIPVVAQNCCINTYLVSYFAVGAYIILALIQDVISYFIAYKGNIAYSAHIAGWIIGFFLGCVFALFKSPRELKRMPKWKLIIASIGTLGFIGQTIFLSYHYWYYWPPVPNGTAPQHYSCCAELLDRVENDHSLTMEMAREQYSCQGDKYGIIKNINEKGNALSFLAW